jgi:RNA polymerase primary sigma factor
MFLSRLTIVRIGPRYVRACSSSGNPLESAIAGQGVRIMSTLTIIENGPAGGCVTFEPEATLPSLQLLRRFDEADRALLSRLFEESVEFVDNGAFRRPGCEKTLFGSKAALSGGATTWFEEVESCDPAEGRPDSSTLNSTQEILLFQRFNYARMRIAKLFEKHRGMEMPYDALRDILGWAHRASIARSQIVQANVPLVLAMAKRTRLSGLDFNELISEGNLALLRSVDKFDCSRGFKFSTYACRAILKSFSRVALRTSRYRGRFPTEFDPSLEKSDFIDRKRDDVEADCVEEIREILSENRAELNDMEQTVIRERFALDANPDSSKPKTLEQVGELIGVTKERVRQIQNKALRKIRLILEDNFLAA